MIPRNGKSRWRTTCPIENFAFLIASLSMLLIWLITPVNSMLKRLHSHVSLFAGWAAGLKGNPKSLTAG
jgi:hypothetical protein